jgi:hypothetical protein
VFAEKFRLMIIVVVDVKTRALSSYLNVSIVIPQYIPPKIAVPAKQTAKSISSLPTSSKRPIKGRFCFV